jgi:hypothetical protein
MGDLINLSRYRKQRQKAEKEQQADQNRIRHGRTKAEKSASERIRTLDRKRMDQAHLSSRQGPDDPPEAG